MLLPLTVDDGVTAAVPVPVKVGDPVLLDVGDPVEERLLVVEGLPVTLALAPLVSEEVGEEDRVELAERVVEGVIEPVAVPLLVGVAVEVGEGVGGGETLPDRDWLAVLLGLPPFVSEAV